MVIGIRKYFVTLTTILLALLLAISILPASANASSGRTLYVDEVTQQMMLDMQVGDSFVTTSQITTSDGTVLEITQIVTQRGEGVKDLQTTVKNSTVFGFTMTTTWGYRDGNILFQSDRISDIYSAIGWKDMGVSSEVHTVFTYLNPQEYYSYHKRDFKCLFVHEYPYILHLCYGDGTSSFQTGIY